MTTTREQITQTGANQVQVDELCRVLAAILARALGNNQETEEEHESGNLLAILQE